jgi:hypothetical protein
LPPTSNGISFEAKDHPQRLENLPSTCPLQIRLVDAILRGQDRYRLLEHLRAEFPIISLAGKRITEDNDNITPLDLGLTRW